MKKRKLSILLICLMMMLAITACGNSKKEKEDADSSVSTENTDNNDDSEDTEDVDGKEDANDKTDVADKEDTKPEDDKKEDTKPEDDKKEDTTQPEEPVLEEVRPLKEVYAGRFETGMCLNTSTIAEKYREQVVTHFTSVTCENEMKPDAVLHEQKTKNGMGDDQTYVAISFDRCQKIVDYCIANGLKMRFHTLVWHAQTPEWFFHESYDNSKPLVDKDTMIARMKNYIFAVIEHLDTNYPGLVYTIDVVNEAFNGNAEYKIKETDNRWYDTIGVDYVYYAFLFAREAIDNSKNMKDVTLVYNDYSMMYKDVTVPKGLNEMFGKFGADPHDYIDALGMQSHISMDTSMKSFLFAARRFLEQGYELQITELDLAIPNISVGTYPDAKQYDLQGKKYRYLMEGLMSLQDEGYNISGVTLWGINDSNSWIANNNLKDSHALLWGKKNEEKPALRGMALCSDIPAWFKFGLDI